MTTIPKSVILYPDGQASMHNDINIIYNTKACPRSQLNGGEKYWKFIPWSRPPKSWRLVQGQSGSGFGMERFRATRLGVSGASPTRTSKRCSQKTERTVKQWQYVANAIGQFARVRRFASLVCKKASGNRSAGLQVCTRIM